ncbi:MAG TPA: sugar ABC transporter permease [Anaerolineae bacterium]|nr:sugar ABC transporter permease [Anaerolineae bacterium]
MLNDSRLHITGVGARGMRRWETVDWGSLPIVLGLIGIWLIFWLANDKFLSPLNLTNLMLQIAAPGTLATGIFLALLLGEIDLSVGVVSGLCAAVMAVLNVKAGVPGPLAVLAGVLVGTGIGLFQGVWVTRLRIPSFIVTLAGMIGWQGALLWVLGSTGTINLRDAFITGIAGTFFKDAWIGLATGAALVAGYAAVVFLDRRRRLAANLPALSARWLLGRVALIVAIVAGALLVFYADRGLPLAVVIFAGLVILIDWLTRRTVYGRHIYAVGGRAESARRAGIQIDRVRISVFALASTIAAIAGVLAASRLLAVNQSSGSSDFLRLFRLQRENARRGDAEAAEHWENSARSASRRFLRSVPSKPGGPENRKVAQPGCGKAYATACSSVSA